MKKILKSKFKMFVALFICLFLSIFLALGLRSPWGQEAEEVIFSKLVGKESELHLQSEVYVVTIPSVQDDSDRKSTRLNSSHIH